MRILALSRYDRNGASSRLRMMQFVPALAEAGLDVEIAPFFDGEYLDQLYAGRKTWRSVLRAFRRRVKQLRSARAFDLIWLEKEALPWFPWPIERMLLPAGVPIVSDYDDAVFHQYDLHRNALVRWFLGTKIDHVMARSGLVVAGNEYLADRARKAGAPKVVVVPTVVDSTRYRVAATRHPSHPKIGWIGTPGTWTSYMKPIQAGLTNIAEKNGATLLAVGAGTAAAPAPRLEVREWAEDGEVEMIQEMDIGIMPLDDTAWSRGKCGYKLIQYMACGLPVVASPVGANNEIVEHGVNGFLADTEEDWIEALGCLLRDPDLRRRMGMAGRKKVEASFSVAAHGPAIARFLREAAANGNRT